MLQLFTNLVRSHSFVIGIVSALLLVGTLLMAGCSAFAPAEARRDGGGVTIHNNSPTAAFNSPDASSSSWSERADNAERQNSADQDTSAEGTFPFPGGG
jgi:hypothetical protein